MAQPHLAFFFTAGWQDGAEELQRTCAAIGLNASVFVHLTESAIPFAETVLRDSRRHDERAITSFLQRCREIGEQLIRSETREVPLTDEVVAERSLGYGGRAMLLSSSVNVPTQTLTAVWQSGAVDGATWRPLLPRRKKR
jgi:hypothetical protein